MERLCGAPVHGNISRALELQLEAIQVTQARRKDEIVNAANPQSHGVPRCNNEKGNAAPSWKFPKLFWGFNCGYVPLQNANLQYAAIPVASAKESLQIDNFTF